MKTSTVDNLIWIFIYGGLLGVGFGLSLQRSNDGLGFTVIVIGGIVAAIGFALIYVRSRMKEDNPSAPEKKTP